MPVPLRLTVWVEGLALSVTVTVPVLVPLAVAVKVTEMPQDAPAARLDPQVFVWAKLPLIAIPVMLSGAVPVFSRVTA